MAAQKSLWMAQHNIDAVRALVEERESHPIVMERRRRNVDGKPPLVDKESLWRMQIMCLLTSQQPSSWNDPVPTLLRQDPFPLALKECQQADNVFAHVRNTLRHRGIRFWDRKIPEAAAENLEKLENGGWDRLMAWAKLLQKRRQRKHDWDNFQSDCELEEKAADYVDRHYKGFGSKQARNFWQALGLTRYVCVVDSRVKRWCSDNLDGPWAGFEPNNRKSYNDMADLLQEICFQARILPCLFDAAAFSYSESGEQEALEASWCRGD